MADVSPKYRTSEFLPPISTDVTTVTDVGSIAHDGLYFWQFMIAGSIAGVIEHTAMFPVDTLKTRMQTLNSSCYSIFSLRHALRSVLAVEGLRGFYRGVSAMGLGAGPAHAVYFSVYELAKKNFSKGKSNNPIAHAASGVMATVASDAVFTPMDTVKQRLQLESSPYKGVSDCLRRVIREEGIGSLYRSYRTTVVMNAPFTAVHFATYEAAKSGLARLSPENTDDELLVVHATAGAAAGALAAAITTPLDVVKTQLQCQGVCGCDTFSRSSIGEVCRSVVRKEGYVGLIRGWKPRMLFHAPAAAICWSTYEATKSFFHVQNSGDK
ncbi:putative Mitochondrial carrier protein [Zostera marina]|uniref:Putative Mitochondrial carrier protein n=1 Tax=Zostera marina TaxID=29655 RepID=A0A0K9NJ68_ZOSMR|nr:putative Mitochondrial carrier protein [Zostera marina]